MNDAREIGEAKVSSLLIKFSVPAIVGMVVSALYNIVDRIFIGQGVGSLGIAGATLGFPIMQLQMAFGMLIGLGGNALVSIRLGEQRKNEAEKVLGNALVLITALSLLLTIPALIFLRPLLRLFGASPVSMPYAMEYMSVIVLGTVFSGIGFGLNHFIRGEGNPRVAMKTMFIGAGLNALLDPLFIFVFDMGVRGAAIATVISQAATMIWVLNYFLGRKSLLKIRRANLRLSRPLVLKIAAIGSAPFAMHIVSSIYAVIVNNQLQRFGGDLAISVMGILNSIAMLFLMPIFGINQGSQPIVGYNYGARKYDRVRTAVSLALAAASVVAFVGYLIVMLFPAGLISLFNPRDAELIAMGSHAMRIFFVLLPVIGFQVIGSSYFQAVGKPKQAMFLALSRQLVFVIPLLFILPRFFALDGVWMVSPVADLMSVLVTALLLWHELRQLGRQHAAGLREEAEAVEPDSIPLE
ncbi:MAG TPA: MATE family efflux transporter [bacterium]|nr:MATE family efflux transporter [bacterium]